MKTVITQTGGRLGNVLFTIAAGSYYAKQNNAKYYVQSNTTFNNDFELYRNNLYSNCDIIDYLGEYNNYMTDTKKEINPVVYSPIISDHNVVYITGCRQSPKYWNNDKQYVLQLFDNPVKDKIIADIKQIFDIDWNNTITLNVRRGDYISVQNVIGLLDTNWYFNALQHFPDDINVLVVSDDIPFCKNIFSGERFQFFESNTFNTVYPRTLYDLYVQTISAGNIISNSTFSWWGAYLNDNPGRKVVCPFEWGHFAGQSKDYIPDNDNWETEQSIWKIY